jgi:hypothetical protein
MRTPNDGEPRRPGSDEPEPVPSSAPAPSPPPKSPGPTSPKKLAANRANAARSTGPRTPEGKARSSQNAVRHGLTSQASLLNGESQEELDELARGMEADLRPRGAAEREIVARIVSLTWRLRRVARVEEAMWASEQAHRFDQADLRLKMRERFGALWGDDDDDDDDDEVIVQSGAWFVAAQFTQKRGASGMEKLAIYEQRLDRALHAAFRELRWMREMRSEFAQEDEAEQPSTASPQPISAPQNASPQPEEHAANSCDGTPRHILQNEPTDTGAELPIPATPVSERSEDPDSGAG